MRETWHTTIKPGMFWDGPSYELKPRRRRWTACLFARFHLQLHPFREAHIVKA